MTPPAASSGLDDTRRVLRHTALYVAARGVPSLINFLALAVYTRLLDPAEFGRYALVIAGASLGRVLFFQWLRLSLLRFVPVYSDHREKLFSSVLAGYFVATCGATFAVIVAVPFVGPDHRALLLAGLLLMCAQAWLDINLDVLRSILAPAKYGILFAARSTLAFGLGTGFALAGLGAAGVIVGTTLGMAVPGLGALVTEWRGARLQLADLRVLRELWRYGFPLTAAFAFSFVLSTSDRLILGWISGADTVGLYAAGYDLAQTAVNGLLLPIGLASFPLAVRALERSGPEAAARDMERNLVMLALVGVPAACGVAVLAPNIAHTLLGSDFRVMAASVIPWIAFAGLTSALIDFHFNRAFQLSNRTGRQLRPFGVAALINVGLTVWLFPLVGPIGAAYATLAAYLVAAGLAWRLGQDVFPIRVAYPALARVVCAALIMTATLFLTRSWLGPVALVAQLMLGGAVYAGALLFIVARLDGLDVLRLLRRRA